MTYDIRESSQHDGQPFELYKFSTVAQEWFVTSNDEPRVYLGDTYEPMAITRTATARSGENKAGNITVDIPRDHELALLFRDYMPVSTLSLVIYRGHDGDSQVVVNFTGRVTSVNMEDVCHFNCAPEEDLLRRIVPVGVYQAPCNKILYSATCGVIAADYEITATLTSILQNGKELRANEFGDAGTDWFKNGYAQIGDDRRMIVNHTGDSCVLLSAFPQALLIGAQVNAFPGCKRTFAVCKSKFSNGPQFLGFERIPRRNPFNGLQY